MQSKTPRVLSIQSHVAYGYAGNKAAVFPMQRLGIEVSPIYTVQLSNHTQYDTFKGSFFTAKDIQNIISGMEENGFLIKHDAILSGYIGSLDVAKIISNTAKKLKLENKNSIYCCDPVFGDKYDDDESGHIFASNDHPKIFLKYLLPLADVITPNLFELSILSGMNIESHSDIVRACRKLIEKTENDNQIIIVTSVSFDKKKTGIAIYQQENFSYIESPKYKVQSKVSGSGDITAAMFLSYLLKGKQPTDALESITKCLDNIFRITHELDTDELALIQSQDFIC